MTSGTNELKEDEHALQQMGAGVSESGEWREFTIGEIAEVVGGGTPSTKLPENFDGDIPWLTPKDLSGRHERYIKRGRRSLSQKGLDTSSAKLIPAGSVLLSTRAPIGYVALAKNAIATNQGFRNLVMRKGFLPEYLYYWLTTNTDRLEQHASGSTFRELSGSALKTIRLHLPPLAEQRRIAHILGILDDKIGLNHRMCDTLEKMARTLFKSWFVDFDPVRAKMEGYWRRGESLPGLPAAWFDLFPDRLVDSELGEVPEGWAVQGLDGIADFTNGLAMQRFPPDDDEWLPVIKIAEMRRGYTNRTGRASREIDPRYIVEDGDVLFSWSGSLELVLWSHGPGALNQHLFKVTSDRYPRWFYWGWTREHLDGFRAIAAGKATTLGHIRRHHLTDAKVAVPPASVVKAADVHLSALLGQQVVQAVQNRTLATLRDTLLPELVSGKTLVELDDAG
ncbi:MAG: restriction endonuclease subunit S [bacterium]|nr:restriction endonuclease subunit S [bacterium]